MNKKGSILILVIIVSVVITILGTALLHKSITENNLAQKYLDSARAFWLAEAGINKALTNARNDITNSELASFGDGEYEFTVVDDGGNLKVTAYGYVPSKDSYRIMHKVETTMSKGIPLDFYDYPIYSAGDVDFNGNTYSVINNESAPKDKAVLYAGNNEIQNPGNITGTISQDVTVTPLARLDFEVPVVIPSLSAISLCL